MRTNNATITPVAGVWAVLVVVLCAVPVSAGVPAVVHDTPGELLGENTAYWIAPYVLYTRLAVGSRIETGVCWYNDDGEVEKRIENASLGIPGYVSHSDSAGVTYHSMNADWEVFIPGTAVASGQSFVTWTPDGRTFVHRYDAGGGTTKIDVFVEGVLAWTSEPFDTVPRELRLDADGSLAVLFESNETGANELTVLVVGRDGKASFRRPIEDGQRILGCNGRGVLVADFDESQPISFCEATGETSFTIPGHAFVGWIPGTNRALFGTTPTPEETLLLVDCDTGDVIWQTLEPGNRILGGGRDLVVMERYLIVSSVRVAQSSLERGWASNPFIELRVYDVATGYLIGSWKSAIVASKLFLFRPRFVRIDGRVFFVDGSRFSRIDPQDIENGRNGWERASAAHD